jgi:hypothetical protein
MSQRPNPPSRIHQRPVAWLLGKQLLGGIKGMLLYTAYGQKLDPRDWMTAEEYSFATAEAEAKGEFWFDYLSDAGDGTKAMYSIAYLALANLWTRLPPGATTLPVNENECRVSTANDGHTLQLPRGEFLFIGGDTAYHASDYLSLVNRIQRPFNYAYLDLKARGLISDGDPRRPIFGIPGNHDYYDQIDGFRRQFRRPVRPEGPLPPGRPGGAHAQLTVAGFMRVQQASYVALRLPFEWRLWGIDTESVSDRREQNLDRRQEKFFKSVSIVNGRVRQPDKLILATSAPSTVFGHLADEHDLKVSRPQEGLGLSRPFLADPDIASTGDGKLGEGQCRLDLSGDVHHYARYWGPQADEIPRKHNTAPRPSARHYASVVSGAGGAFHHPSSTYDNEICEQVLYPSENVSRDAVSKRIFKFWNVMTGGYVWLAGFILAFIIYFGVTGPKSSRQVISNLSVLNTLGLTNWERVGPAIVQPGNVEPCSNVKPLALWTTLDQVTGEWIPPARCTAEMPAYFFPDVPRPLDLKIGQGFIFVALGAIIVSFILSVFTKKIFNDASPFAKGNNPAKKLLPIVGVITLLAIIGLFSIRPYRNHITPFGSSLLVLFSIITAITAIILNLRYSEYLFKKSFVPPESTGAAAVVGRIVDDYFPWVLWLIAIVILAFGLSFFGQNNLPTYLTSDIVFTVVLIAAVIGIILLPFKVAGALFSTAPAPIPILGKLLIGVWHLILQLFVPFVLVKLGNWMTWAIALVLLVLPIPLARMLLKRDLRIALLLLWFLYGLVMLKLPWLLSSFGPPVFAEFSGWESLLPALVAGLVGAVICCLWTGWYFGVCFVFNGHNNEVGGAARIEEFKEFIRFRLTPNGLTGYVIAVDEVSFINESDHEGRIRDGSDLKPKLIDVFHLVPKTNDATQKR